MRQAAAPAPAQPFHASTSVPRPAALAPVLAILALAAFNLPPGPAQHAATMRRALQIAGTTLQQGVDAPNLLRILNPFAPDRVMADVRFAQRHRLSVFAASLRPPARIRALLQQADRSRLPACLGEVNTFYRLDATRFVLRAWLASPKPARTIEWVQVDDASGQPAATLPAYERRDENPLGPNHTPVMGVLTGFAGAIGDGDVTLIGVPDAGAPCRLTAPGPGPVRIQPLPQQRPSPLAMLGLAGGPMPGPQGASDWQSSSSFMPAGLGAPWQETGQGAVLWTSAAKGGACHGRVAPADLTFRVKPPATGLGLVLPFATGGSPDGQALLFQTDDGARIDVKIPSDTEAGQWRLAAIPAEWLARHPGDVTVTARDPGAGDQGAGDQCAGAGQWFAIAAPAAMRLDPDAARLAQD